MLGSEMGPRTLRHASMCPIESKITVVDRLGCVKFDCFSRMYCYFFSSTFVISFLTTIEALWHHCLL